MVHVLCLRAAGNGHCLAVVLFLDPHLQFRSTVPSDAVGTADGPLLRFVERAFSITVTRLRHLDVDADVGLSQIHHIATAVASEAMTATGEHNEFMSPFAAAEV